jgi:CheY-like chemotaxis protein
VLAVDDDPDTLEFLCFVLEREGALVTCVDRSDAALARLKEASPASRPHVLISDLAMPKKDGAWLIREIRSLPADEGGEVPALALTAFTSQATAEQLAEAGFQMRLTKPMDPQALVKAVRSLAGF